VLRILAAHPDLPDDLAARRVDQHYLVVFLDGGGQQLAIARHIDAFGRFAQCRACKHGTARRIDGQHRIGGLIAKIKPPAIG
jgi:hypothetical protein